MHLIHTIDRVPSKPTRRVSLSALLAVALAAGVACAGDDHSSNESTVAQCEQLREHMLDVRLKSAPLTPTMAERHRENLRVSSSASIAWCTSHLTASQTACAMQAQNAVALESCLPAMAPPSTAE